MRVAIDFRLWRAHSESQTRLGSRERMENVSTKSYNYIHEPLCLLSLGGLLVRLMFSETFVLANPSKCKSDGADDEQHSKWEILSRRNINARFAIVSTQRLTFFRQWTCLRHRSAWATRYQRLSAHTAAPRHLFPFIDTFLPPLINSSIIEGIRKF